MNFEDAYKKYNDGTATPEETEYVKTVLEQAKTISETANGSAPVIDNAEEKDVKGVKKFIALKIAAKTVLWTAVGLLAAASIIIGVLFGISVPAAKGRINISEADAEQAAIAYVTERADSYGLSPVVTDMDKEFEMESDLVSSYYRYEYKMLTDKYELKVKVNADTGEIKCVVKDHVHDKTENKGQDDGDDD